MLLQLVAHHGCKKWSHIASFLHGRLGKQCRERCVNWKSVVAPETSL
jgi:hypothetical protein